MRGLGGQMEAIWRTDTTTFNARVICVDYFNCRDIYSDNGTSCESCRDLQTVILLRASGGDQWLIRLPASRGFVWSCDGLRRRNLFLQKLRTWARSFRLVGPSSDSTVDNCSHAAGGCRLHRTKCEVCENIYGNNLTSLNIYLVFFPPHRCLRSYYDFPCSITSR